MVWVGLGSVGFVVVWSLNNGRAPARLPTLARHPAPPRGPSVASFRAFVKRFRCSVCGGYAVWFSLFREDGVGVMLSIDLADPRFLRERRLPVVVERYPGRLVEDCRRGVGDSVSSEGRCDRMREVGLRWRRLVGLVGLERAERMSACCADELLWREGSHE
jgi:hypothetical protein